MEAVSSELTFFTLPNCFELFGFDFLVDEAWNVWLLEVGNSISFQWHKATFARLIKKLFIQTFPVMWDLLLSFTSGRLLQVTDLGLLYLPVLWEEGIVQANAEPDMKQTGGRLKGIISSLVEGTLELALQLSDTQQVSSFIYLCFEDRWCLQSISHFKKAWITESFLGAWVV